jgi:flagellin-like protein
MRKLLKSRKALSPVIAAIILVAVTVAVSIAVAAWMGALTFSMMGSSSLNIYNVNFQGTSGVANNTIVLSIKNTGTKQVTIGVVKINNIVKTWSGTTTYDPSVTGTITVYMGSSYWSNGNPYQIDMYDTSGTGLGSTQKNAGA